MLWNDCRVGGDESQRGQGMRRGVAAEWRVRLQRHCTGYRIDYVEPELEAGDRPCMDGGFRAAGPVRRESRADRGLLELRYQEHHHAARSQFLDSAMSCNR